jgi:nicotinate-nucleotide adenylyltransferase
MSLLLGIFGGAFDPPHIGHLILASEAYTQLVLDRVLWVLTPDPPHKWARSITPLELRLAMVQLAIGEDPIFDLSYVDIDRPGPHYAVDTVEIISEQSPGAELVYLIGGDLLQGLPTWFGSTNLVSMCHFLGVTCRPGYSIELTSLEKTIPGVTGKIHFVDVPSMNISSHAIRARIAEGRPFRYLLHPEVYEYIVDHHLYR